MKLTATIRNSTHPTIRREAIVHLHGHPVAFFVANDNRPDVQPETEVQVELDPQDQYATILP
jgi:hypothetical protein